MANLKELQPSKAAGKSIISVACSCLVLWIRLTNIIMVILPYSQKALISKNLS